MKKLTTLIAATLISITAAARAELLIEITGGSLEPTPIAVVPFGGPADAAALDLHSVVVADLERSGRFKALPSRQMLSLPGAASKILFQEWRQLKVDYLIVGTWSRSGAKKLSLSYALYDVRRQDRMLDGKLQAKIDSDELRLLAHRLSDELHLKLSGMRGLAATRIAYVSSRQQSGRLRHFLHVTDADGRRDQVIISSDQPLLSPTWSPRGDELAYVSFEKGHPQVFRYNLRSGRRRALFGGGEHSSSPAWSPDGRRIAMTLAREGNVDIYLLELASGRLRRLTRHRGIDTEPAWTPDGRDLIFTSDRGGAPQIYRLQVNRRGSVRRLSMEGDYNARAAPLPDGSGVLMVHGSQGDYHIAHQDFATGKVQILTDTQLDESPSIAPNGDMLIYASNHKGRGVLSLLSLSHGGVARLSVRNGRVGEPAWSPFRR